MRRVFMLLTLASVVLARTTVAEPTPSTKKIEHRTVALLPLTGDAHLVLYGQPVAREIARVLTADGLEVVVVGANAAVPTRARLVIDGTIERGSDGSIHLSARVRDPIAGEQVDRVQATAHELTAIDEAAQRLAAELSPALQRQLALTNIVPRPEAPVPPPRTIVDVQPLRPSAHLAIHMSATNDLAHSEMVAAAFSDAFARPLTSLGFDVPHAAASPPSIAVDIAIDVVDLSLELADAPTSVSTARARAHVRVSHAGKLDFDRVVATDTVVGRVGAGPQALVAAIAAQVAEIVRPQIRRARRP